MHEHSIRRCYALMLARGEPPSSLKHLPLAARTPRQLRLLYLKEGDHLSP